MVFIALVDARVFIPAAVPERNNQRLEIARIVGEHLDALIRDEDRIGVAEAT